MMRIRVRGTSLILMVVVAASIACSGSKSPVSPTAVTQPVAAPAAGTATGTGTATILGVVTGVSASSQSVRALDAGITVTIEGTTIIAAVDSAGQFELNGVPAGDARLRFTASGVNATLTLTGIGDQQRIEIRVALTGTTAAVDTQLRTGADGRVEIEGLIQAVDATARTIEIQGRTVNVPVGTPIRHGSTYLQLADLKPNDRVHVKGTVSGSIVTATEILAQQPAAGWPSDEQVRVSGIISGLSGTCPTLSFTVGATAVTTSAATVFSKWPCSTLMNGVMVEVQGSRQTDGSVAALDVRLVTIELNGPIMAAPTGTCPALTFTVGRTVVTTTAATLFAEASCTALAANMVVEVTGLQQAGGVLALKVEAREVKLAGAVTALTGTCPARSFTVGGVQVATSALTEFSGATCSALANSIMVEVKGYQVATGPLTAREVKFTITEIEGPVTSVTAATSCPTLTFAAGGKTVTTTALTVFAGGGACTGLEVGQKVWVKGLTWMDGAITATWIKFTR